MALPTPFPQAISTFPLFPSLPRSIPASPTETPRYTGVSPEGGSTSLSFPSDPKHGKHPSPSSSLSLHANGERLSGARPSPGTAPGKGWTVAFTLGRKEPPTKQDQGRGLVRELLWLEGFEGLGQGRRPSSPWRSFSIAKNIFPKPSSGCTQWLEVWFQSKTAVCEG